jgi:hypothetical protein
MQHYSTRELIAVASSDWLISELSSHMYFAGVAGSVVVKALFYKPEGRGFEAR